LPVLIYASYGLEWAVLDSRFLAATIAVGAHTVFALALILVVELLDKDVYDCGILAAQLQSDVFPLHPLPETAQITERRLPKANDWIGKYTSEIDQVRNAFCLKAGAAAPARCLLITSAVRTEEKMPLATWLAARCGMAGLSTLLIDADWLAEIGVGACLGLPGGPGLTDVLEGMATIDEATVPCANGGFCVLRAGTPVPAAVRLFEEKKSKLESLLNRIRGRYDVIIIDSPPVLLRPEAEELCRHVDTVILAALYGYSRHPQVAEAKRRLEATGVASIGAVLAGCPVKAPGHSWPVRIATGPRDWVFTGICLMLILGASWFILPSIRSMRVHRRGNAWLECRQYDKAIAEFTDGIRLDPADAYAYRRRGYASNLIKDYDKAIADFSEAIRLKPGDADAFDGRGYAWFKIKNYD
jgi:Mrp family chromosome partitioning ATPase